MKKVIGLLILITLMGAQKALAQAPDWQWAVQSDGPKFGNATPESLCIDKFGNIYVAVVFDSVVTIGDSIFHATRYNTQTSQSLLIVKYNSEGKIIWIHHPDGAVGNPVMALDSIGNMYLGGSADEMNFGDSVKVHNGTFIVKYDSGGNAIWGENLLDYNNFGIFSIATDKSNNFYLTGDFTGSFAFGGLSFNADSSEGSLVAKFNNAGKMQWIKQPLSCHTIPGAYKDIDATSLSLSEDFENVVIFIAGEINADTVFFGKNFITPNDESSITVQVYLARLNADGDCDWVRNVDQHQQVATGYESGVCSNSNYVYVSGNFDINAPSDSDNEELSYYAFIAKYDKFGAPQWERKLSTLVIDPLFNYFPIWSNNPQVDAAENIYLSGYFEGPTDFAGIIDSSASPYVWDEFAIKFDSAGNRVWMKQSGKSGGGYISNPGTEALYGENLYIAGSFDSAVSFGSSQVVRHDSGYNENTFFLAKLGSIPSSVNTKPITSQNSFTLFPDPAASQATITFSVDRPSVVTLEIYDLLGRRMKQVSLGEMGTGEHSEMLDLKGLSNGTYLCRMTTGGEVMNNTFVVMN